MGSVARKGAAKVLEPPLESVPQAPCEVVEDTPEQVEEALLRAQRRAAQQARSKQLRKEAYEAVQRGGLTVEPVASFRSRQRGRKRVPLVASNTKGGTRVLKAQELEDAVGHRTALRYRQRLVQAEVAYESCDYHKAWRILEDMIKDAPRVPEVRELAGLTLYRLGRWLPAAAELEVLRELTGRTDLHPVLADCYRAQCRWDDVDAIWAELKNAKPTAAVLAEGRVVAACALGDQGEHQAAVQMLSAGFQLPRRAKEHHLRQVYALADLCEQAGDIPRARELFGWLKRQDEFYVDVAERFEMLN